MKAQIRNYLGCGNHGCVYGPHPAGGMATNGRCRCFCGLPLAERLRLTAVVTAFRRVAEELRKRGKHEWADEVEAGSFCQGMPDPGWGGKQ